MQHAGLQYGQGAANSHQSPPFAHTDIPQPGGGNTTSSLRQFRKKESLEKNTSDLTTSITENSHIARVPPHNHYPARPNDYYHYHNQYTNYNPPYKEPSNAQVKYSEITETPSQPIQHVDHIPNAIQKHKEPHKDFMDMCNITQQAHMKQSYADNLSRQQSYPDPTSVSHQYLHKELSQVHPSYKPESQFLSKDLQYQQYPQVAKYNMPSQCRKYPPPSHENDLLAKLQRINPTIARSIMSDHHIRESQPTYPTIDQNRMYPQNQRYYPTHIQNNPPYNYHGMSQPYNYPSSCNYKPSDYTRSNQMAVGTGRYPHTINPHAERSISPRRNYTENIPMPINYGSAPQKVSPNYPQYNPPEFAQHYQHRRPSLHQEYYQQPCRPSPYITEHQISPEPNDNRESSGLKHYLENWAEEEGAAEIAPIFKENMRMHEEGTDEQVYVINSSEIPPCLENVALVPTENGQYIIKSGPLDNSVVRIKETTESNGERTVNLQILEATDKPDCMMAAAAENLKSDPIVDAAEKAIEEIANIVPCTNNEKQNSEEKSAENPKNEETRTTEEHLEKSEDSTRKAQEETVIVSPKVIKDMPLIEDKEKQLEETVQPPSPQSEETSSAISEETDVLENPEKDEEPCLAVATETQINSSTKRTQRIFSVDDIINSVGSLSKKPRRNSLQLTNDFATKTVEEIDNTTKNEETPEVENEELEESEETEVQYKSAISIDGDSVIIEIGGALVQLNVNYLNGTKVLSVLPLSESLVIDVNGNYTTAEDIELEDDCREEIINSNEEINDSSENSEPKTQATDEVVEEVSTVTCQTEVVIGEEEIDENNVTVEVNAEARNNEEKVEVTSNNVAEITEEKDNEEKVEVTSSSNQPEESSCESDNCKISENNKDVMEKSEPQQTVVANESEKEKSEIKRKKRRNTVDGEDKRNKRICKDMSDKPEETTKRPPKEENNKKLGESKSRIQKKSNKVNQEEKEVTASSSNKKKTESFEESNKRQRKTSRKNSVKELNSKSSKISQKETEVVVEEKSKPLKKPVKAEVVEASSSEHEGKKRKSLKVSLDKKNLNEENEAKTAYKKTPELTSIEKEKKDNENESKKCIPDDTKTSKSSNKASKVSSSDNTAENRSRSEEPERAIFTKAAKKMYVENIASEENKKKQQKQIDVKRSMSKLEKTVNKIKSLKEKTIQDDTRLQQPVDEKKTPKKVTFSPELDEKTEENDRKKLSWEEYNRKRKLSSTTNIDPPKKTVENIVTSSTDVDDVIEKVEMSIESAMINNPIVSVKKPSPKIADTSWEDEVDTPQPPTNKLDDMPNVNPNKCIIDVNEFNIKPIDDQSSPPSISSSHFSSHSEADSLQQYKDVVDSKLNSLDIKIPKFSKAKLVESTATRKFSDLIEKFLSKGTLNGSELESVKKIIEFKRKIEEDITKKHLTYDVRGQCDFIEKDLKIHFKEESSKRKRKRFRNLYTDDSSDDSDSSKEAVGDYSVFQRNSQGVPKLIFKRKSGLPQPFVKLERSQAAELLVKKRKMY